MAEKANYIFVVAMDVDPEYEDLFNEVYDHEHAPNLAEVTGVISVHRMKGEHFSLLVGGEQHEIEPSSPVYSTVYEIESPDVLTSPEWGAAVERGRWAPQVRPHTKNRRHRLYKVLSTI